ncbi:MAG: HIT domain-containing protein [Desulfovibrionales bacterium]
MMDFNIDSALRQDCHILGRFPACHLLLHKNATIPWLILVPETMVTDLFELKDSVRARVLDECGLAAGIVRSHFRVSRINFAQIGNLVPQLHLHVVGRFEGDACWPAPVWGSPCPRKEYTEDEIRSLKLALQDLAGFMPVADL